MKMRASNEEEQISADVQAVAEQSSTNAVGQSSTVASASTTSIEAGRKNSNVANSVEQFSEATTTTPSPSSFTTPTPLTTTTATTTPTTAAATLQFIINFHHICAVTALLPLFTLFACFVTAYVFQYDDVHETHCRVYNVIPSISAITGISPQRYFWRFSIALHVGPRLPIAFIYKNYYSNLLQKVESRMDPLARQRVNFLIGLTLILNCIEVMALGGVTYVSNRENYPVHEQIFIVFMTCSLIHMLTTIKLHDILQEDPHQLTSQQLKSIKYKKSLFALSILCTLGLLVFFAKHRWYCHDLAFTWFAFFEYVIAVCNMLFHFTIIWDFPTQFMIITQGRNSYELEAMLNSPKASMKKLN